MSWNEGYRTDTVYTYGYYREMNPQEMRFLTLMAGYMPPEVRSACELGYGQGVSLNIHAAAENIEWYGTDFNPAQVGFAREMAEASGARAHCSAEPFQEFCERKDLPEFDYIALHGIWSWISPENRAAIAHLIDRKLRVGGALYISYNTAPGWAAFRPARDLMKLYIDSHDAAGMNILAKVRDSFAFMTRLKEAAPAYLKQNPGVEARIDSFKDKDASYLAHEFFNDDWDPVNFQEMAAILGEARMTFVCSANPVQLIMGLGMNEAQRKLLARLGDPVLRETVQDFIYNTQFRKDYWIKGPRPLAQPVRASLLRAEQIILTTPRDKLTREVKTGIGTVNISEAALAIFRQVLSDGKVHDIAELEKAAYEMNQRDNKPEGIEKENLMTLCQAICVLLSGSQLAIAQKKQDALKARPAAEKLNLFIENLAVSVGGINYLASPVIGGGLAISRFDMLFLLALRRNAKTAQQLAIFARDCLRLANQHIVEDGKALTEPDEALAYLQKQAEAFLQDRLGVFKDLLIA